MAISIKAKTEDRGVFMGSGIDALRVRPSDGLNLTIVAGYASVGGVVVEIAPFETITISMNDGDRDRTDVVALVVRTDVDGNKTPLLEVFTDKSLATWVSDVDMVPLAEVNVKPRVPMLGEESIKDCRQGVPAGVSFWETEDSRPLGVTAGTVGWNDALSTLEVWNGSQWQPLATAAGTEVHKHDGGDITGIVPDARFADGSKGPLDRPAFGPGPWHAVYVNGDGQFMRNSSSAKYKKNIQTYVCDAADVTELRTVMYDREDSDVRNELGLIAEEVAEVFPEVVIFDEQGEPDGVDYARLVLPLINTVTDQQRRIDALERAFAEYITEED